MFPKICFGVSFRFLQSFVVITEDRELKLCSIVKFQKALTVKQGLHKARMTAGFHLSRLFSLKTRTQNKGFTAVSNNTSILVNYLMGNCSATERKTHFEGAKYPLIL